AKLDGEIAGASLFGEKVIRDRIRVRLHVGIIEIVIDDELADVVHFGRVEKEVRPGARAHVAEQGAVELPDGGVELGLKIRASGGIDVGEPIEQRLPLARVK